MSSMLTCYDRQLRQWKLTIISQFTGLKNYPRRGSNNWQRDCCSLFLYACFLQSLKNFHLYQSVPGGSHHHLKLALLNTANNLVLPPLIPYTDFYNSTLDHIDLMEEYHTCQSFGNSQSKVWWIKYLEDRDLI